MPSDRCNGSGTLGFQPRLPPSAAPLALIGFQFWVPARAFGAGAGTRALRALVRWDGRNWYGEHNQCVRPVLPIDRTGRVDEVTARLSASPSMMGTGARLRRGRRDSPRFARLVFVIPSTSACYAVLGKATLGPSDLAAVRSQRDRTGLALATPTLVRRIASQFDDGCVVSFARDLASLLRRLARFASRKARCSCDY